MSFCQSPVTSDKLPVTSQVHGKGTPQKVDVSWGHEPGLRAVPARSASPTAEGPERPIAPVLATRCARGPGALRVRRFMGGARDRSLTLPWERQGNSCVVSSNPPLAESTETV